MVRTAATILQETKDTLFTASMGLQLVKAKKPRERMAGLRNLIVFGRAVTNVLQNLRSVVGTSFDDWYAPKVTEMRDDPVMTYFYKLRSEILKEGKLQTISAVSFNGNPWL